MLHSDRVDNYGMNDFSLPYDTRTLATFHHTTGIPVPSDLPPLPDHLAPIPDCACRFVAEDRRATRLRARHYQHDGGLERVVLIVDAATATVEEVRTVIDGLDPTQTTLRIVVSQPAERRRWLRRILPPSASDRRTMHAAMEDAVRAAQLKGFVSSGWMILDHFGLLAKELRHEDGFDRAVVMSHDHGLSRRDRPVRMLKRAGVALG